MESPPHDPQHDPGPGDPGPTGILLSRDLIFTSKVTGTARELGTASWWPATGRWRRP